MPEIETKPEPDASQEAVATAIDFCVVAFLIFAAVCAWAAWSYLTKGGS